MLDCGMQDVNEKMNPLHPSAFISGSCIASELSKIGPLLSRLERFSSSFLLHNER